MNMTSLIGKTALVTGEQECPFQLKVANDPRAEQRRAR
jgi:hypothetical protein